MNRDSKQPISLERVSKGCLIGLLVWEVLSINVPPDIQFFPHLCVPRAQNRAENVQKAVQHAEVRGEQSVTHKWAFHLQTKPTPSVIIYA